LILVILGFSSTIVRSQTYVSTADLFKKNYSDAGSGKLNIIQNPALDTLLNRYILGFRNQEAKNPGMEGFRIQIYRKNIRNAREESNAILALFMSRFPDITTHQLFQDPGYFIIRVGDFRTKAEATRLFVLISKDKEFKDAAYIVPDIIDYPDKNTK